MSEMVKQASLKFSASKRMITKLVHGRQLRNWPNEERCALISKLYDHISHCIQCRENGEADSLAVEMYIWQRDYDMKMAGLKTKLVTGEYIERPIDITRTTYEDVEPIGKQCPRCGNPDKEVFCSQPKCIHLNILKE